MSTREQIKADREAARIELSEQLGRIEVLTGAVGHPGYSGTTVSFDREQFENLLAWVESQ